MTVSDGNDSPFTPTNPRNEKTKMIFDMEDAVSYGVRSLQNVQEKMDVYVDENGLSMIKKNSI